VTILEPHFGAYLYESPDVGVVFTVEAPPTWRGDSAQVAVVRVHQHDNPSGWLDFARIPLPDLSSAAGAGVAHETGVKLAGMPNGGYDLQVLIEGGGGGDRTDAERTGEGTWAASTTFRVEVALELSQVLEGEDDGSGGEDGEFSAEDRAAMEMCEERGLEVRRRPARIFDGFIYKNEIDLLEVRCEEIGDLVTGMILVEAGRTFQGAAKDLIFPSQAQRLPPDVQGKIKHVVEDFSALPASADAWAREYAQRDAVAKGLGDGSAPGDARPDDIVLISDVDEIPKRWAVQLLRVCQGYWAPAFMAADMHYYGFQAAFADAWMQGPKIVMRRMMHGGVGPAMVRRVLPLKPHGDILPSAAWHCSYFVRASDGGCEPLLGKLTSFSHTEWLATNVSELRYIENMVREGRDLFEEHYGIRSGGLSREFAARCCCLPAHILRDLADESTCALHTSLPQ